MRIAINGYIVSNDDKEIYDYFGIAATCPADISAAIEEANGEPLDVEINSPGGYVFSGNEIYTMLRAYSGEVNIRVVGLAASAASMIAMAGHCEMSPVAMLMVHNASSCAAGDYHEMDKASGMLQSVNKALAAAYMAKSGMSEADALAMMDKESWLTAQQAVEKGLIDKVMFTDGQLTASLDSGMIPRSVIEKTRNELHPLGNPKCDAELEKAKAVLALELAL